MLRFLALISTLSLLWPAAAVAQETWTDGREDPPLWEIADVDETGLDSWPFGAEDIADDGGMLSSAEALIDLQTTYTSPEANRFWVRSYVVSSDPPPSSAVYYVFMDTDLDTGTGGGADDTDIFRAFDNDPTDGGYEVAVGIQGDGSIIELWTWDSSPGRWNTVSLGPNDLNAAVGSSNDPIGIGSDTHGYFQFDVNASVANVNDACDARLFVRIWNDDLNNDFGDDALDAFECVAPQDPDGNPDVLQPPGCQSDADCPGDNSVCLDSGACLIGYECTSDGDCLPDQVCSANNVCVTASTTMCTSDADCDGLICSNGMCMPCSDTGDTACPTGEVCAPNGSCVPEDQPPNLADPDGPEVQGGACVCSVRSSAPGPGWPILAGLLLLTALGLLVRSRRTERPVRQLR